MKEKTQAISSESTSSVEEFDEAWLEEFGELFMSWFYAWISAVEEGPIEPSKGRSTNCPERVSDLPKPR